MNEQEIFDKVATHLLKQMKQSADGEATCMYRGLDGLQCAVGCLIPDGRYDPALERKAVDDLYDDCTLDEVLGFETTPDTRALLVDLQTTHDVYEPSMWRKKLFGVARKFKLAEHALSRTVSDV